MYLTLERGYAQSQQHLFHKYWEHFPFKETNDYTVNGLVLSETTDGASSLANAKYFMISDVDEGIGHHRKVLLRLLQLSRKSNRTFVEPCYQDGRIKTCNSTSIVDNLMDLQKGKMVPLSFYWNVSVLSRLCPMIPFKLFVSLNQNASAHLITSSMYKGAPGRYEDFHIPSKSSFSWRANVLCRTQECWNSKIVILGRIRRSSKELFTMHELAANFLPNTFTIVWYSQKFREMFLGDKYIAFQWRSEHMLLGLSDLHFTCAQVLTEIIRLVQKSSPVKILLISDIVYPGSFIEGSLSSSAIKTFRNLTEVEQGNNINVPKLLQETGAVKVDFASQWIQDRGVLAMIDLQLASWSSDLYVCSAGAVCRACAVEYCRFQNEETYLNAFANMLVHSRLVHSVCLEYTKFPDCLANIRVNKNYPYGSWMDALDKTRNPQVLYEKKQLSALLEVVNNRTKEVQCEKRGRRMGKKYGFQQPAP